MPAITPTKAQNSPLRMVLTRPPRPASMPAAPSRGGTCRFPRSPPHARDRRAQRQMSAKGVSRDARLPEQALRAHEQRQDQHDERDDRLVDRLDPAEEAAPGRELRREAEQDPAGEGAVRAADPAEDDRG